MKKSTVLSLVLAAGAAGLAGLVFAHIELRKERDQEASAEAPVVAPSRVERGTNGGASVKLDAETRQRLGLKTAVPAAGSVARSIPATARVLDGAPLAGHLSDIRSAELALETVSVDYNRKKYLFDNGRNAPAAAVEAAAASVKQSRAALDSARDRLAAAWGPDVAKRADLDALGRALLARQAALARVELPATARSGAAPQAVRLYRQNGEEAGSARVLGAALSADSAAAGQAYLALVSTNAAGLVPGSFLVAAIETGTRESGVVLPREAVLRHAGLGWVYVEAPAGVFTRRAVPLDCPHPDGWLAPGPWTQPVVVSGAQSLLSEELKGGIEMRD